MIPRTEPGVWRGEGSMAEHGEITEEMSFPNPDVPTLPIDGGMVRRAEMRRRRSSLAIRASSPSPMGKRPSPFLRKVITTPIRRERRRVRTRTRPG